MFRIRVVRDVSCVRSCGREVGFRCRGVFGVHVSLLLLLRLVAPLVSGRFPVSEISHFLNFFIFIFYFFTFFIFNFFHFCSSDLFFLLFFLLPFFLHF